MGWSLFRDFQLGTVHQLEQREWDFDETEQLGVDARSAERSGERLDAELLRCAREEPASQVGVQTVEIVAGTTERDVAVRTNEVLGAVLATERRKYVAFIDQRARRRRAHEMANVDELPVARDELPKSRGLPSFLLSAQEQT